MTSSDVRVGRLHPTVPMLSPWGDHVDIDELVADVVEQMWDAEVRTYFSCQGFLIGEPRPRSAVRHGYLTVGSEHRAVATRVLPRSWRRRWDAKGPKLLFGMTLPTETVRFARPGVYNARI